MKHYRHKATQNVLQEGFVPLGDRTDKYEFVYVLPYWQENRPDNKPPKGKRVLVTYKISGMNIDEWDEEHGWLDNSKDDYTYWMPAPPLPEEKLKPKRIEKLDTKGCHSMGEIAIRRTINAIINKLEEEK